MAAAQPRLPKDLISGSYRWGASGSRCDVAGASEALETRLCREYNRNNGNIMGM